MNHRVHQSLISQRTVCIDADRFFMAQLESTPNDHRLILARAKKPLFLHIAFPRPDPLALQSRQKMNLCTPIQGKKENK
ncbi:MAG: hypothetical protein ACK56R_13080 [Pirellulaceae bacterium]